jgi:predicted phage tail protein
MNNFTIYLATLLCLLASKVLGQETFEKRAKNIAAKIETITKEEKSALKEEVEAVNNQLEKGSITLEQAENKKKVLAEARAINIETRVGKEQENLKNLVQEKVDGKISESDTIKKSNQLILKWEKGDKKTYR